jgi:hypothetical protein
VEPHTLDCFVISLRFIPQSDAFIQRPAAYPPSDGYQPPEDPIIAVARQINVVRQLKELITKVGQASSQNQNTASPISGGKADHFTPPPMILIGTAYSYLQEYLPHVAQYVVRNGWADMIGLGRVTLTARVRRRAACRCRSTAQSPPSIVRKGERLRPLL